MNKKQLLIDFSWGLVIVLAALFASYLRDSGYTDGDTVTRVVMCLNGLMVASFGNRVPQSILPQNKISFFRQIASKSLVFGGIVFAGLWAIAEISIASSAGIVVLVTAFIFMTRQSGRTQVAHPTYSTTKLPVLYQHLKGKAHGYFINSQTQLSC